VAEEPSLYTHSVTVFELTTFSAHWITLVASGLIYAMAGSVSAGVVLSHPLELQAIILSVLFASI